jgi:septal ring factor EnvC (AmiA/AmiB activator)
MDSHFTVTIHDHNGVKQYNLHKFVKKALLYAVLFLGFIALISVGTIFYLSDEVDIIESKRVQEQNDYIKLQDKNGELYANINAMEDRLKDKKKELDKISDSLSDIEAMMGISPVEDVPIQERVDLALLNSEDMTTLLQFIPNGSPIEYKGITSKYGYRVHPLLKRRVSSWKRYES